MKTILKLVINGSRSGSCGLIRLFKLGWAPSVQPHNSRNEEYNNNYKFNPEFSINYLS